MPTRIVIDQPAVESFCRRWGVTELELFGSAIRDDFRADSDVDVLASFADDRRPTLLTLVQVMTPPAKAGGFSGNGMTCSEGVAVYRLRLKAPSEPLNQLQHVASGVQVSPETQAAGTRMPAVSK